MKDSIEIINKKNSTQLRMSLEVFYLTVRMSSYINDNFEATDFFTIGNTTHKVFADFLNFLQKVQATIIANDTVVIFSLDSIQYSIFENVFYIGDRYFYDHDTEEFKGELDVIESIKEIVWDRYSLDT